MICVSNVAVDFMRKVTIIIVTNFPLFSRVVSAVIWGLDDDGYFIRPAEKGSSGITGMLMRTMGKLDQTEDVAQSILADLEAIHRALAAETQELEIAQLVARMKAGAAEAEKHTDVELIRWQRKVGRRLLYLFQRDLMPGISGKILESKGERDNKRSLGVPLWQKITGWAFIGLLNVLMLFYILLFALNQPAPRQSAWARSFALWLVVEIFLVSTGIVLATHIVLPSLILSDVNKIKKRLLENISRFNSGLHTQDGGSSSEDFNAADYLFVSTRLAKQIPDLREAKIVAQFRTPWPKQSYHHVTQVSKIYSKKFTAVGRSAYLLVMFTLTNVLSLPLNFQDIVIEMLSTVVVGYTVLLHMDLYHIYPALVILPLIVVGLIVHFVISSNSSEVQKSLASLLPQQQQRSAVRLNELSKSEAPADASFTNIGAESDLPVDEQSPMVPDPAAMRAAEAELAALHSHAAVGSQSATAAAGIISYLRKQPHTAAGGVLHNNTAQAAEGGAKRPVRHLTRLQAAVQKVQILNQLEAAQRGPSLALLEGSEDEEEKQSDSALSSRTPDHSSLKNAFNTAAMERTLRELSAEEDESDSATPPEQTVSAQDPSALSEMTLEANLKRPPMASTEASHTGDSDNSDSDFEDFDFQGLSMRYNINTGQPLRGSPHTARPAVSHATPQVAPPKPKQATRMGERANSGGSKGVKATSHDDSDDSSDEADDIDFNRLLPQKALSARSVPSDSDQHGDLHRPAPVTQVYRPAATGAVNAAATVADLLNFSDGEYSESEGESFDFESDSEYDFNAFLPSSASSRNLAGKIQQHASASTLSHSGSDNDAGSDGSGTEGSGSDREGYHSGA